MAVMILFFLMKFRQIETLAFFFSRIFLENTQFNGVFETIKTVNKLINYKLYWMLIFYVRVRILQCFKHLLRKL